MSIIDIKKGILISTPQQTNFIKQKTNQDHLTSPSFPTSSPHVNNPQQSY